MHSANGLAWSVCVCVCMCVSVSTAYPAVADKQIELPLRMCNCRGQKLKKHELHRVYPNTDDFSKPGFRVRFGFCSFERRRQAYNAYGVYNSTIPAKLRDSIRIRISRSDSIRFDSDGPIRKFSNRPCLPIARSSQTTQTINSAQWYSIQTR